MTVTNGVPVFVHKPQFEQPCTSSHYMYWCWNAKLYM